MTRNQKPSLPPKAADHACVAQVEFCDDLDDRAAGSGRIRAWMVSGVPALRFGEDAQQVQPQRRDCLPRERAIVPTARVGASASSLQSTIDSSFARVLGVLTDG